MSDETGITEMEISAKVTAKVGFPDGHVEVGIRVPVVGRVWVRIESQELFRVGDVLNQAFDHLKAINTIKPRK
jgi:hypothetical protein